MTRKITPLILGLMCLACSVIAQPTINISSASANNGEMVDINVTVDNYTNYISLEFFMLFDPAVARYQGVSNLTTGLPDFATNPLVINVNQLDPGQLDTLNVVWFDPNLDPNTLPDGEILFTITFEIVGEPCASTDLVIPNVEIVDVDEEVVPTTINPGSIMVPGVDCGTFDGIRIIGEQKIVNSGSPVCIKFTSEGFEDLLVASYVMTFDPAVIQYTGIQNVGWPDLLSGNYSDANAAAGRLSVVWSDPGGGSISLPDGTVLYELCFTAVGNGGQMSQINYTSFGPTPLEFANADEEILDFQGVPGKVTIEGVIEGFALIMPNVQAGPGSEVCVPITVNDFIDIIAVQTSINWDSTILEFDRFEGFNLPNLSESVLGPEGAGNNASQASIAWSDPLLEGVTLPNGSEIVRICFNVIGACEQTSPVVFSPEPVGGIEFADINDEITDYTLVDGSVFVSCVGCGITNINVLDICAGGEVGNIDITLDPSCEQPITYLWNTTPPETTQDLTGVPAGKYIVTITYGGNMFIVSDTIEVRVLQPIQVSANITDAPGGNDGAVMITVTGGEPGYTFNWNTTPPSTTQNISNLAPGQYTVTITDANGCTFVAGPFEVKANSGSIVTNDCSKSCGGAINIISVDCVPGPHTFMWSNGLPPVANVTNLCSGSYTVTVTGMGGATCTMDFQVLEPATSIEVAVDTTSETGPGGNGAIDLTVTGGQPPYAFEWSDGPFTTEDRNGLTSGSYTVTITDGLNCEVVRTILLIGDELFVDITGSSYNGSGVSCANMCDGEVLALPGNAVGNVTYLWNNARTTQVISGVCAGIYTVTVTDDIGQTATASFTLTEPDPLILQLEINCASDPGVADGSVFAEVSGGTPPYNYLWNTNSMETSLQNVQSGPYLLMVIDDNACQLIQQLDVGICGIDCYQAVTVITPNGDGKNDRFTINCIHDLPNKLSVYNRYGGLEFEMQNYNNSWEGTDQDGNVLSDGGYHWVLQVFTPGGEVRIYRGTVSLVISLD